MSNAPHARAGSVSVDRTDTGDSYFQPRSASRLASIDERELATALLIRAAALVDAPRAALVYSRLGVPGCTVALLTTASGQADWIEMPAARLPEPEAAEYLCDDLGRESPSMSVFEDGVVRDDPATALAPEVLAQLNARTLLGWVLEGLGWIGHLLVLDKPQPTHADLVLGRSAARLSVVRFDEFFVAEESRGALVRHERAQIARDLHDGVLQTLSALTLQLDSTTTHLDTDLAQCKARIAHIVDVVASEHRAVRSYIDELRSSPSPDAGTPADLGARLRTLTARIHEHWALDVSLTLTPPALLVPSALAHNVYWLVHEALVNVARHAGATVARVTVERVEQQLEITVADNGGGLHQHGLFDAGGFAAGRGGPRSVRERVALLVGALLIQSTPRGTTLRLRLPLPPQR